MPEQTSHASKWEWWGRTHSWQPFYLGDWQYRSAHVCSNLALPAVYTRANSVTDTHPHSHVKGVLQAELSSQTPSHAKASYSTPANRRGQEPPHPPSSEDKLGRMSEGLGQSGWWGWVVVVGGNQQAALKCKNVLQAWSKRGTECRELTEQQMSHRGRSRRDADSHRRVLQWPAELTTVCRFHKYGQ